jgi:hypothetical protein
MTETGIGEDNQFICPCVAGPENRIRRAARASLAAQ